MKKFGNELAEEIKKRRETYIATMDRRTERIRNFETDEEDCFISQRVEERAVHECNVQLDILKGDGLMEITVLENDSGEAFEPHSVQTRYGYALVVNGVFASSLKALCKKTGMHEATRKVPCWTKFDGGSGSGMYAVYTGDYQTVRWHTNMVTGEYYGFDSFVPVSKK